ncbi:hypothetical protein [Streptomyces hesseae]|uniref:DUF3558 domain-containing protein n=1 Tax=Streptomyces hesseae TaxID=3075519 RepID=A0ABU2SIA4_9ACTN|nr:hypothetical protein [Streptomyces sp. DSM 40473]MDT0448129.1 hypothetical protein [Streptomyces sp. DSM 40473]
MRTARWRTRNGGWTQALAAALMLGATAGCGGGADARDAGRPAAAGTAKPAGSEAPATPDTALDAQALRRALPDLQSMPTGWRAGLVPLTVRDVPEAERCRKDGERQENCTLHRSRGMAQYRPQGDAGVVDIALTAYPDRPTSQTAYRNLTTSRSHQGSALSMPRVGDESAAFAHPRAPYAGPSITLTVRVGTAVASLTYQEADRNRDSSQALLSVARMQAKRLLEAEQGRMPTAVAE